MARRQVSIFINGREVANTIKSISAEKRKLVRELNNMTIGSKEYIEKAKEIELLNDKIKKHRLTIGSVESSWDKIKAGATRFIGAAAAAFTVDAAVEFGKEMFTLGTQMEVLEKKAKTVFGEALPLVTAAAKENAHAMGLTIGQYTNAAASIGDLLIPMGFQREEAANISTSLVDLSGALSEWTGGQKSAKEVTDILGKAILGEREELKQLGISIQEADITARLAEKGLQNLTGEMLQQAKAAATLELITEKSVDAQAAHAANSDTLVRKQAELRAKFEEIKGVMANALIPVFHRLFEVAHPIISVLGDIVASLFSGEKATGAYAGVTNALVTVIQNASKVVAFFWEILKGVGGFIFTSLAPVFDFIGTKVLQFYNILVDAVNGLQDFTGIDVGKLEAIDISEFKQSIADAKASIEESGLEEPIETEVNVTTNQNTINTTSSINERLSTSAGGDDKAAEREAKELERKFQRLKEITEKYQEEELLNRLSAEDRKLAELAKKYDEQIALAAELEAKGNAQATAQRLELERLKEQAIAELQAEIAAEKQAKREEEAQAEIDAEIERSLAAIEAQAEAEKELRDFLKEEAELELEEARVLALEQLEFQFQEMLALAEQHGIDTAALTEGYRRKKAKIEADYDKKDKAQRVKAHVAQANALAESFGNAASIISSTMDAMAALGIKNAGLGKALAIAEIAFNTAKAIASGVASASSVPYPGNLVAIASTVATVLGNIASAKQILDGAKVPQKKKGRWHNVKGQDDNTTYRAEYIGSTPSGMLPSHPVVLASERGAEYFVSHQDLQNPYVFNHVQAIDNIVKYRQPQYVEGGFTEGETTEQENQETAATPEINQLTNAVNNLNSILAAGIWARIDDETVIGINLKFDELNEASGGILGN